MAKRSREDSISSSSHSSGISVETNLHSSKYTQISDDLCPVEVMQCSLPPHEPISFTSYEDYEIHCAKIHTNRCLECKKNFPSELLLNLHIGENHDPLNEALREKGEKTYQCFVSDCEKICSNPSKRRMHLVDKHRFPKNYDFFVVNDGLDKRSSMLRGRPSQYHRRRSSAASKAITRDQNAPQSRRSSLLPAAGDNHDGSSDLKAESSKTDAHQTLQPPLESPSLTPKELAPTSNKDVDSLTVGMASLKFVPPSVRFGRGGRKAGLARS